MKKIIVSLLLVSTLGIMSFDSYTKKTKVLIDLGHGGEDLGGKINDYVEKDIVTKIGTKIEQLNTNSDIEIHFTRTEDKQLSLASRVDLIKSLHPDLLISLHTNAHKDTNKSGIECYVSENETKDALKSYDMAHNLIAEFENKMSLRSQGVKKAPYFILKKSEVPAMLVELGYLSNKNDADYLTTAEGQEMIARTLLSYLSKI